MMYKQQKQWSLTLEQQNFVPTRSNEIRGSRELHGSRLRLLFKIVEEHILTIFNRINSAPVVCAHLYFYTAFGYLSHSSWENHPILCLGSFTFRSLSSLSGLSVYLHGKIQTNFFLCCAIKALACKIISTIICTFSPVEDRAF